MLSVQGCHAGDIFQNRPYIPSWNIGITGSPRTLPWEKHRAAGKHSMPFSGND